MAPVKIPEKCENNLFCGVNMVSDLNNMTDLEKKHLPIITVPEKITANEKFDVIVEVGRLMPHPNELTHFIEFIELYAGDQYLARMDFTPETTYPTMKVTVCLNHIHGSLRAFTRCNLHGTWEGCVDITINE